MTLKEKIQYLYDNCLYRDALTCCIRALEGKNDALRQKALVLWDCSERGTDEWRRVAKGLILETLDLL